jgi:DNA-directed RNA polymerase subunit RPC12/RpoP
MVELTDETPQPSLFRDLADGRAGFGVRIVVALALGVFLAGVGLVLSYWLAAVVPYWNRARYFVSSANRYPGVFPRDELIVMMMILAGVVWIGAVFWLFFKHSRRRALFRPIGYTIGIIAVTVFLGILADDSLRGESEYVIAGLSLIAGAWIVLIWVQGIRRMATGRPIRNKQDQHADVRCPECGYRMVGLYESRCPECGKGYTLDELIARQNFVKQDLRTTAPPPPPVPTEEGAPASPPGVLMGSYP